MPYFIKIDPDGIGRLGGDFPVAPPGWVQGSEANYLQRWGGSSWVDTPEALAFRTQRTAEQPLRDREAALAIAEATFRAVVSSYEADGLSWPEASMRLLYQLIGAVPAASRTPFMNNFRTRVDAAQSAAQAQARANQ